MIEPHDIRELLEKEPFEPFRILMSDGKTYDVTNPSMAVAMIGNFFIALPRGRWKLLAYNNMSGVENQGEVGGSRRRK
jgi:hypothetical protein